MTHPVVRAGFIPLVDAAPFIVAHECGFAEDAGLTLDLSRSTSWAGLRDRLSVGEVDCAHMLSPVVIASQLGLGNPKAPMVVPFGLSMNGNAISVSVALHEAMIKAGWSPQNLRDPASSAGALAEVVRQRQTTGQTQLTFASVYPFSTHTYELRYWLASAGIDPDVDVHLTIVPPPMMGNAFAEGHIDGCCVGAPWSSLSAESGYSQIVALKVDMWRQGPEKVLAVREHWADQVPQTLYPLVRMLFDSAVWCADSSNLNELAQIMSKPHYLDMDAAVIAKSLSGSILSNAQNPVEDHLLFDPTRASYPWRSQALWFYAQMVRWGQIEHSEVHALAAKKAYRPDIYRKAMAQAGDTMTGANASGKGAAFLTALEGAKPDTTLFDQRLFDPDDLDGYFAGLGLVPAKP